MTIRTILARKGNDVFTVRPTATLKNAVDQMYKRGVAALIVQSDNDIMGIVSERDVVSALSRFGERAFALTVKDIFALTTITVTPDDSITKVMRLMTLHRLRHIPVIADRELVGIISIGDVVKHRVEDLETEANVLRDLRIASR